MSIDRFYSYIISTKRLTDVDDTNKETYQTHLSGIYCRIEATSDEPVQLGDSVFYTLYKMWCEEIDIQVGDRVVDKDGLIYFVKGVMKYDKDVAVRQTKKHHFEVSLARPIK